MFCYEKENDKENGMHQNVLDFENKIIEKSEQKPIDENFKLKRYLNWLPLPVNYYDLEEFENIESIVLPKQ